MDLISLHVNQPISCSDYIIVEVLFKTLVEVFHAIYRTSLLKNFQNRCFIRRENKGLQSLQTPVKLYHM